MTLPQGALPQPLAPPDVCRIWVHGRFSQERLAKICVKSFDARTALHEHSSVALDPLCSAWHQQHEGIQKPVARRKEKGLTESQCFKEGCCHCRRGQHHPHLWQWVLRTRRALQHLFPPRSAPLDDLINGLVVVVWVGFGSAGELQHRFTHVPCTT